MQDLTDASTDEDCLAFESLCNFIPMTQLEIVASHIISGPSWLESLFTTICIKNTSFREAKLTSSRAATPVVFGQGPTLP